jgi:hypothetical protein
MTTNHAAKRLLLADVTDQARRQVHKRGASGKEDETEDAEAERLREDDEDGAGHPQQDSHNEKDQGADANVHTSKIPRSRGPGSPLPVLPESVDTAV